MDSHFVRRTTAAPRHHPSTSRSSTANLDFPRNLFYVKTRAKKWKDCMQEHDVAMYPLEAILRCDSEPPANSYQSLKTWICKKLNISSDDVLCDKEVKAFQEMVPIFSSTRIRPDVTVYYNDKPVLCIKVHSSPYDETINKLAWVLIEHLRWLRNCKTTIDKCVGFAFPKFEEESSVMKVTCSWDTSTLKFELDYSPLACHEVAGAVESTYAATKDMCGDLVPNSGMYGIPLSQETLQLFGENSTQLSSHYSWVIQSNDAVYKYAFDVDEYNRLLILNLNLEDLGRPQQYQLPLGTSVKCNKIFVKFEPLLYPMSREQVRRCFRAFVVSVCDALDELHSNGIAHLDVRLENICFSPQTHKAVLIDLDRSQSVTSGVGSIVYTNSVMYDVPSDWTLRMVDFRQLGVLILDVALAMRGYHEMRIPEVSDEFVTSLLKGQYSRDSLSNSYIVTEGRSLQEVLSSR